VATVIEFDCETGAVLTRDESDQERVSREAAAAAYALEVEEAAATAAATQTVRAWLDAQAVDPTVRAALARVLGVGA
jgi:hypothetical protein